jgi:hypothetical protein
MSSAAAPQPMTITAGACAPGVPVQPTTLSNVPFAAANSPPPAEMTVTDTSALSTRTTTSALIYTQTAAVDAAQLLLIAQSVGAACASVSTYAWPATLQQAVVEVPAPTPPASASASAPARTVTVLPATAPASSSSSAATPAAQPDDESYSDGRLGPYQSAGVGVSCTVVFLVAVYLLFLSYRRWQRRRRRAQVDDESARGKVAELPADCECAKHKAVAELPAPAAPVELPAFEAWVGTGTLSELSSGDDVGSERGKSGSPLGDWLPTPT